MAQVPKLVVLEHFTNTYCSICANSNPNLNANMANQSDVLRISYHPSSPYSGCSLNQHNVSGNDDRTNQYGVYGGTPRIVIQGEVQQAGGGNFSNPALFDNYSGQTAPISVDVTTDTTVSDSMIVMVTITVEDQLTIDQQYPILYVGLGEDTIFFNAPNGEADHINVFRKELNGSTGNGISLDDVIGTIETYSFTVARNSNWDLARIFGYAIVQDANTNEIFQAGASNFTPDFSSSVEAQMAQNYSYFISNNLLNISLNDINLFDQVVIFDLQGKVVSSRVINSDQISIDISDLNPSMYIVQLINITVPTAASFKIVK